MRLKELQYKHRGRLAFVLGDGPSLHYEKLEGISGYVTFAVESAVLKYRAADYFVGDDPDLLNWDYFYNLLPKVRGTCLLNDVFAEVADRIPFERRCFYTLRPWHDVSTRPDTSTFVMSDDVPLVRSGAAIGSAINLAHVMGCDPIILLGADCCYLQEKQYCWNYPGESKPQRLKGHPTPTRKILIRGKTVDDQNRETMDSLAALSRSNPYSNIINASTQGLLDCFPKMPYADVVARFGSLTK